jgi:hypothetical protein
MHFHMAMLNTSGHQRADRAKILGKSDGCYDHHQLGRCRVAQHFERPFGQRVQGCQTADGSNRQGNFQFKF